MTWISTDEAMELTGKKKARLYQLIKLQGWITRKGRKSRNGKSKTEIQLESLPAKIQERYFQSLQGSADGKGVDLLSANAAGLGHEPAAASALLASATREQLEGISRTHEILQPALAGDRGRAVMEGIAQQIGACIRTVRNLCKAVEREGIAGLLRKPREDRGRSRVADAQVVANIKMLYLKPHRPPISEIHRQIARDYEMSGLEPPSYSFVCGVVSTIPPDIVAKLRIGEREYDNKFAYISLRNKPALPRQWVDADHHPCDHNVVFPDGSIGRPWLTAMQDICDNEILGWTLSKTKPVGKGSYPGTQAISTTLRQAILKNGLFDNFYVDLGRDFRSQQTRAVLADLGIKWVPTRGYHGKSKPIERWFGIMEGQLKHLPGYCGRRPEENPERQKLKPEPLDPAKLLRIDQFEVELVKWIERFHHAESRALKGRSPMEVLADHVKNGFNVRHVQNERVLDLLLMSRADRLVRNAGIEAFSTHGRQRFFFAPQLLDLIGQRVSIRWDASNIGEIYVYTTGDKETSRFVCKATNKEMMDYGADEPMLTREREIKREQRRRLNERCEEMVKQARYPNPMARAAAERRYDEVLRDERQKLAANAHPPGKRVYKLLSKYALADKALKIEKKLQSAQGEGKSRERNPYSEEMIEAKEIERKKTVEALRENRWLDDDEPPRTDENRNEPSALIAEAGYRCHGCNKEAALLQYCLTCPEDTAITVCLTCGGYKAHRYCQKNCAAGHDKELHPEKFRPWQLEEDEVEPSLKLEEQNG